jgi:hypothetical protein
MRLARNRHAVGIHNGLFLYWTSCDRHVCVQRVWRVRRCSGLHCHGDDTCAISIFLSEITAINRSRFVTAWLDIVDTYTSQTVLYESEFAWSVLKGKVLSVLNWALRHEGALGSGCLDPLFLDLGTSWRWVVSFPALPLNPRRKSFLCPLYRRLAGPQSRSGRYVEVKIVDPTCPDCSQSLYRLRYRAWLDGL